MANVRIKTFLLAIGRAYIATLRPSRGRREENLFFQPIEGERLHLLVAFEKVV